MDGVAALDAQAVGVLRGQLDLGCGALELELGDALDGGSGEQRPVAEQLERTGGRLGWDRLVGALGWRRLEGNAVGKPSLLAQVLVGDAAEDALGQLGEDERGVRRDLDVETGGELDRKSVV